MTNNNVSNIIPLKGNLPILPIGKKWQDLASGQVGFFDASTNLSIDATSKSKNIYILAGYDTNGDGSIDTLKRSAGFEMQLNNLSSYNLRKYNPAKPQIFLFEDLVGGCDSTYSIKFKGWNDEIFRMIGWLGQSKQYIVTTPCKQDCEDCVKCNKQVLAPLFAAKINEDENSLFLAEVVDENGDLVADIPAYIAIEANADKPLNLKVTSIISSVMQKVCNIPYNYAWPRVKSFVASIGAGFRCSGTVSETQELSYEQGSGDDIRYQEYRVGGWEGNPGAMRTGGSASGHRPYSVEYLANELKYDQIWVGYSQTGWTGWAAETSPLSTMIAIPVGDTDTLTSIITVLDSIAALYGFDPLADDSAEQDSATGTDISEIDDEDKDGIA